MFVGNLDDAREISESLKTCIQHEETALLSLRDTVGAQPQNERVMLQSIIAARLQECGKFQYCISCNHIVCYQLFYHSFITDKLSLAESIFSL